MTGYAALADYQVAKSTTSKVCLLDQNHKTKTSSLNAGRKIIGSNVFRYDTQKQKKFSAYPITWQQKGFDPPPVFTSSSSSNFGFSFLLLLPVFPAVSEGAAAEASPTDGRTKIIRFLLLLPSFSPDLLP